MKTTKKIDTKIILELSTKDVADLIYALQDTDDLIKSTGKDLCMPTILSDLENQLNTRLEDLELFTDN